MGEGGGTGEREALSLLLHVESGAGWLCCSLLLHMNKRMSLMQCVRTVLVVRRMVCMEIIPLYS